MAKPFTRGKTKPWGDNIRYPAHDHDPAVPLEDVRLEQFALLMARNAPMRRAILTAFPNASTTATNYRAHKLLACKGVRERVEYLQARVGLPVGQAKNSTMGDVPPVASTILPPKESLSHQTLLGEPKNRFDAQSSDLTPAELRRIISEGARAGNSAAINAAIKMLDASLSAPPALVDPAAVCALLFNGGGGGETLRAIVARLAEVYGLQSLNDAVKGAVSHNMNYVALSQSQSVAPQQDTKRVNMAQCAPDGVQGAGVAGSVVHSGEGAAQDGTAQRKATGGRGEGGELSQPITYTIASENFTPKNATKPTNTPLAPPASDES